MKTRSEDLLTVFVQVPTIAQFRGRISGACVLTLFGSVWCFLALAFWLIVRVGRFLLAHSRPPHFLGGAHYGSYLCEAFRALIIRSQPPRKKERAFVVASCLGLREP